MRVSIHVPLSLSQLPPEDHRNMSRDFGRFPEKLWNINSALRILSFAKVMYVYMENLDYGPEKVK